MSNFDIEINAIFSITKSENTDLYRIYIYIYLSKASVKYIENWKHTKRKHNMTRDDHSSCPIAETTVAHSSFWWWRHQPRLMAIWCHGRAAWWRHQLRLMAIWCHGRAAIVCCMGVSICIYNFLRIYIVFAIKSGKHVCQKSCFFEVAPIVPESFMIYIYIIYQVSMS